MSLKEDEVVNPYNDPLSKQRKGLLVKSPWSSDHLDYIQKNNIKALYFNSVKGWEQSDFAFLAALDGIEEIDIIASEINNFAAIEAVRTLQQLSVTGVVKDSVNFQSLAHLECCFLSWWKGAQSVLSSPSLEIAYFDELKLEDYGALGGLSRVRSLTIGNSPVKNVRWLSEINSSLRELHLLNCRQLVEFENISRQTELRRLSISGSKNLYDLTFISSLKNLEFLDLSDSHKLKSLEPLAELKELRAFAFAGSKTTVEDRNLTPLTSLPKLSMLMFGPRKGYSHKLIKKWDWRNFEKPDRLLEPA